MDIYMHETMASVVSLEKIKIIRSQEFMPSEARLKFLKKMIILGPKTAILGPQFCRILVLGPHFWWSGGAQAPGAPLDPPLRCCCFWYNCKSMIRSHRTKANANVKGLYGFVVLLVISNQFSSFGIVQLLVDDSFRSTFSYHFRPHGTEQGAHCNSR